MPFAAGATAARSALLSAVLGIAFAIQIIFGYRNASVAAPRDILPPVPTAFEMRAAAFGDDELLYRFLVQSLQDFGDTGGRFTRMADYDMSQVIGWLKALDTLDPDAGYHLMLATNYFGYTQNVADLDPLIRYVQQAVALSPSRRWRWLLEAIYMAQVKRHDVPTATELAVQLSSYDYPDMPIIARQMGALLEERSGNYQAAGDIMGRILDAHEKDVSPDEAAYMAAWRDAMWRRARGEGSSVQGQARPPVPTRAHHPH